MHRCKHCIETGLLVNRVITKSRKYQSGGCASYLKLAIKFGIEELSLAIIQACSSSRHISCLKRPTSTRQKKETMTVALKPGALLKKPAIFLRKNEPGVFIPSAIFSSFILSACPEPRLTSSHDPFFCKWLGKKATDITLRQQNPGSSPTCSRKSYIKIFASQKNYYSLIRKS